MRTTSSLRVVYIHIMSHGSAETARLKANIQDQLNRLLTQLKDLDELRSELDEEEYTETHKDTVDQLAEFDAQLKRMMEGDMTLVSELGAIKLALEAAIASAFNTNDVLRSFAKRQPAALRTRLAQMHEELKLGRLPGEAFKKGALDILQSLKRLGEELSADEKRLLDVCSDMRSHFEDASAVSIGESSVMSMAATAAAAGGPKR